MRWRLLLHVREEVLSKAEKVPNLQFATTTSTLWVAVFFFGYM